MSIIRLVNFVAEYEQTLSLYQVAVYLRNYCGESLAHLSVIPCPERLRQFIPIQLNQFLQTVNFARVVVSPFIRPYPGHEGEVALDGWCPATWVDESVLPFVDFRPVRIPDRHFERGAFLNRLIA